MGDAIGWRRTVTLGLLGAALAAAGGCGSDSEKTTFSATTAVRRDRFTEARTLFNEMCAGCHSLADADAHGRRFDLDKDSPLVQFLDTEAARIALARESIEDGADGMPKWGGVISQREIDQLVDYVISVVKDERAQAR